MTEREQAPLSPGKLDAIDAWWRTANYLSMG
jgi:phosphoketolase